MTETGSPSRRIALSRFLEQPKHALDGHVHDGVRRLLASGQVQDVRRSRHGFGNHRAIRDRAFDYLDAGVFLQHPVVAERTDGTIFESGSCEQSGNEVLANLAGCSSDQDDSRHGYSLVRATHSNIKLAVYR
jgi:hypothetical protein